MGQAVKGTITIEGHEIPITNPDKPLWPEAGVTKALYLRKLAVLAPFLLKYCHHRLLTVIRWPHGIHGDFFIRKMPHVLGRTILKPPCMMALNISCSANCHNSSGLVIKLRWNSTPLCTKRETSCPVNG